MSEHDALARERARTVFDRPLVVEAGAGTGKTTTLIARICTWCVGPGWALAAADGGDDSTIAARVLDGVVAITFTEAAAAEMAGRFGAALVDIAAGRPVVGIPALPGSPADGQRRARALLGAVDRLVVSTIHAFCARVLAAAPTEAGLHPAHRVDADGTLLADVVHEVVVDWFTEIFSGYPPERERLVLLAQRGVGSESVVEALTELAANAIPADALAAEVYTPAALGALHRHVKDVFGGWHRLVHPRIDGATIAAEKATELRDGLVALTRIAARLPSLSPLESVPVLRELAAAAETIDWERLRDYGNRRFLKNEAVLFGKDAGPISLASRDALRLVFHLRRLDPDLLDAGRGVLVPLLDRVNVELRRRGVVSFEQLLRGARDLLRSDPRLRARFRSGITQLLVDEFQDTDDLQCELVRMLALEGERRPGLFLVGDPKQSIYGWRSADLVAYQGFVDEVRAQGGELLSLDVNRRSLPPILAEVERVIEPIMRFEKGYQATFQPLHSARHDAPHPPKPWAPVEHWISWELDAAGQPVKLAAEEVARLEAKALAADLLRLRAETGIAWDKVGVLLRSTGDLDKYLTALREAGIPFVVERNRQYFRRREIIDAAALVRCILEPEDTLALLTVLRSPLVGVPDAAVLPLWREKLPGCMAQLHGEDPETIAMIRAAASAAARVAGASGAPGIGRVEGWEHLLVEVAAHIGWLREAHERLPADRFVSALRTRLPLETLSAARYLGEFRVANLQRFYLELVGTLAQGDPQAALRALRTGVAGRREAEEARPTDSAERAVRVMTIHKSKGLDFEHVYLLQLHKGRRDASPSAGGDRTQVKEMRGAWQYQLFGARTPGWDEVAEHDARIEANERVRLLYVAMTRAKDRLVLLGNWQPDAEVLPLPQAKNLLDLVAARPDRPPLLEVAQAGAVEASGALWRLADPEIGARPVDLPRAPDAPPPALPDEDARAAAAARRMSRPTSLAASAAAHHRLEGDLAAPAPIQDEPAPAEAAPGEPAAPSVPATVIGTAVHRAIELLDPAAGVEAQLQATRATVREELGRVLASDALPIGLARADRLVTGFVKGALGARFRALKRHILARELPMLSAPEGEEGPVGFVQGAIDLLYRDPATGEVVVADYKTDAVRTAEERDARAATYALQAAVYVHAVQAALGLPKPPRAELWFLARDEIVVV